MDDEQDRPTVEKMRRYALSGYAALIAMAVLSAIAFVIMHLQAKSSAETHRLTVFYDFFVLVELVVSGVIAQAIVLMTWWPQPSARWFQGVLGPQVLLAFLGYGWGNELVHSGQRQPVLYFVVAAAPVVVALVLWVFGRTTGRDRRVESS